MEQIDVIVLVALPVETQNMLEDKVKTIYTGLGKVNAASAATEAILKYKPKKVINYGSAGSHVFKQGQLVDCSKFVQRDMDATGLGFELYETPFDEKGAKTLDFSHLDNPIGHHATCYTGDSFVTDKSKEFEVIDMESYAIAKVCFKYDVDFVAYKYISDGADENSGIEWEENVKNGINEFVGRLEELL